MPRPRPERPVIQRHRGGWAIVWWDGSRRRRVATGAKDEQGARRFLADFDARRGRGATPVTCQDALNTYVEAKASKVVAGDRLREAATAVGRGLGHLRLDQVSQEQWDRYARGRVTRPPRRGDPAKHKPRPVSTGTLRREFNVLRAALRMAWKANHIAKPPTLTPPPDTAPRDRYLTKDEARKLLAACVTPHVRTFLALAMFTGARKGSILALRWDRVSFETGIVDFQEEGRQLTAKRRAIVPMNPSLRAILETARQVATSDYVVEYNGGPVPFGLRWSFNRLCVTAGLTWRPTPHHIKHSVASWLAMERVPIDQAADMLATDPATLRRTYRKFDPTYLRSATNALEL